MTQRTLALAGALILAACGTARGPIRGPHPPAEYL